MRVVSALQYTGGPLSTLRRSLPFCFLRLSLFGHVIAPDVIDGHRDATLVFFFPVAATFVFFLSVTAVFVGFLALARST
jgi:hypothetical protein